MVRSCARGAGGSATQGSADLGQSWPHGWAYILVLSWRNEEAGHHTKRNEETSETQMKEKTENKSLPTLKLQLA